jgi:methyltransferase (TIGR00027 family)
MGTGWRLAILAAAARAYTSHEPDPIVRNPDWLADPLLSPDEIALLDNHPMGRAVNQDYRIAALDPEVSGLARPVLVATRYIDEHLDRALRDGFNTIVILNAGLDSRAHRLRPRLQGKRLIEIDGETAQARKRQRMEAVLGPPPPFLAYTAIDIEHSDLAIVLPRERFFAIWEGASMHYPEPVVRRTLSSIAKTSGTRLVMDFVPASQVDKVARDPVAPQARWDASWGDPWVFGVPDRSEAQFFRDLGFDPQDRLDTSSPEALRRYLTRRDGSSFGPPPNAPGTGFEEYLKRVLIELVASEH